MTSTAGQQSSSPCLSAVPCITHSCTKACCTSLGERCCSKETGKGGGRRTCKRAKRVQKESWKNSYMWHYGLGNLCKNKLTCGTQSHTKVGVACISPTWSENLQEFLSGYWHISIFQQATKQQCCTLLTRPASLKLFRYSYAIKIIMSYLICEE